MTVIMSIGGYVVQDMLLYLLAMDAHGLGPARLAVAWRQDDRRLPVPAFVESCLDAVADASGEARAVEGA